VAASLLRHIIAAVLDYHDIGMFDVVYNTRVSGDSVYVQC